MDWVETKSLFVFLKCFLQLTCIKQINAEREVAIGDLLIRAFGVPHDAADPIGMVITSQEGVRLGIATDMGVMPRSAIDALQEIHGLVLESNHDEEMLISGSYPWEIKQRIRSRTGHLSNQQVKGFLADLLSASLRHLVFAHLSEENNNPALVKLLGREVLSNEGATHVKMKIAHQHNPIPLWEV